MTISRCGIHLFVQGSFFFKARTTKKFFEITAYSQNVGQT